ncbi:MAG TPA: hypothetical protein VFZ09_25135 [Archangium sp.]|uniref:hypothetical protein n=1 Tax=Archangium sp. TaxID=1872627 RepID=UPI002E2ECD17|nr:hypothetical protein [Archangium sp.]HEX5749538.1 hypothetical protein [Archangium sp.]
MSTAFGPASTSVPQKPADPTKHVNYVLGMILGAEDFTQEFAYLSERDRRVVRELLGYGTAWGLAVSTRTGKGGLEVEVAPGMAVSPSGQFIHVQPAQCASLPGWVANHADALKEKLKDVGAANKAHLPLHVVLGYQEQRTDPIPIPGEPCRSEEEAHPESRIADSFHLELRLEPPPTGEELAVRELILWLKNNLDPTPFAGGTDDATLQAFLERLRTEWPEARKQWPTPEGAGRSPHTAPPQVIPPEELPRYLRAAFRLWVTKLRPDWHDPKPGEKQAEDGVLLAALWLPLTRASEQAAWELATTEPGNIRVDEEQRPFLLSQRLLQEWLVRGISTPAATTSPQPPEPPPPQPAVYQVVAAGVVKGVDEPGMEDTFGNLRALRAGKGEVLFTFDGYVDPQFRQSGYVVKVLPMSIEQVRVPTVVFGGFEAKGFSVYVFDHQGVPVEAEVIQKLRFVIEVSWFPLGGKP